VAMGIAHVVVPGVADPAVINAFRGRSINLGFPLVAGRWFSAPNEVVMPRAMLNETHVRIGDWFSGTIEGHPVRLHVVGEAFSINNFGPSVWMDWSTLASAAPKSEPFYYWVFLTPGSDAEAYVSHIQARSPDLLSVQVNRAHAFTPVTTINAVLVILAAVLAL